MRAGIFTSTRGVFTLRPLLSGLAAAAFATALFGGSPAAGQIASSAQVSVSAQFVDPIGIRQTADMVIAPARKADGASVRVGATPAAFATAGADGRIVSVETASSLSRLDGQIAAGASLRAQPLGQLAAPLAGRPIEVAAEAALPASAPAGAYRASYSVVMNLN